MTDKRRMPRSGEFYRHFKGKLYQIITVAEHSETGEALVIYQALYGNFKTYARPLSMFMSEVDRGKYSDAGQIYRFEKVKKDLSTAETEKTEEKKETFDFETEIREPEFEENNPLLDFLDAKDHESRLNILTRYRDTISEVMLDSMGLSMDCILNGQSREEKYDELEKILRTKAHYEKEPR